MSWKFLKGVSPTVSHLLPVDIANKILNSKQRPINPHSQRLLAAEAREANALPKAKAKAAAKEKPKAKATAKDAPIAGGDSSCEPTRTEYSLAKAKFMLENLSCI